MHNLRVTRFEETTVRENLPLTATAWSTNDDSLVCAFGPTPADPTVYLKRRIKVESLDEARLHNTQTKFVPITSWDAPCPLPELECDEILLLHHFADTVTTCVVLAGGDLILVREDPAPDQEAIEIVGSIDVGIAAAAWAPDEELLAIVTRSDNLILMSRHLEPVTEVTLTAQDLSVSKHVSVGWGKKETQFQGKRAKAMRDPTMPEQVDEGKPSPLEDGSVNLSWRGDGAFLAVNSVVPDHRRVIRVYSREGVLDGVSEPADGLESALSWRPFGNLIASIKRSGEPPDQDKLEVVFFERNGLRHGQFPLRLSSAERQTKANKISLSWNIDSTVLAVSFLESVQLWTMGNYHYYLKQDLQFANKASTSPLKIKWHSEKPLSCAIMRPDKVFSIEYISSINQGPTLSPVDFGVVAVIDGCNLKLTPFKHAGVPPPMAFCEPTVEASIVDCAISRDARQIAVLTHSTICLLDWEMRLTKTSAGQELKHTPQIKQTSISLRNLRDDLVDLHGGQICYLGDYLLFCFFPAQRHQSAKCFYLRAKKNSTEVWSSAEFKQSLSLKSMDVPRFSRGLHTDVAQESVWVQTTDEVIALKEWHASVELYPSKFVVGGPDLVIFASGSTYKSSYHTADRPNYAVYLTSKGVLYVGERLLARDCTSYIVTDTYIVFTTSQHLLKFVRHASPENLDVPGDTPETGERCRSIERGAKIVTVIPSIYAVVLQMPRGNLETIYPRALVVNGIRKKVQSLEYTAALLACQNHQVDMNILYDHLPDTFMANIGRFIDDLKKPGRIDEFLSKLNEDDVTQTLYKDSIQTTSVNTVNSVRTNGITPRNQSQSLKQGKVNRICDAIITVLEQKPSKYLQNIITAHVCKRPPDLTSALTLVSSLRSTSTEEAEMAIAHLCFLTDANLLYNAALTLYDLELTVLVAQNAQRDPREYMPFLQDLQSLPQLRRQHTIDNHLRNYPKALVSLHSLNAHDEVEAYTIKHNLYTTAIDLYKYDTTGPYLTKLTTLYAQHLKSQSQHGPAAILYDSLGNHAAAYPAYALAHLWRESLTCAALVPLTSSQLRTHAESLATSLTQDPTRDYKSAATIHSDYLSDPLTAARLLCKASHFAEATRLLTLPHPSIPDPTKTITSTITPALLDKLSETLTLFADCQSQLSAQVPRILDLRLKKSQDPLAFFGGDPAATDVDFPDNISLAPTDVSTAAGSMFTRYTGPAGTTMTGASKRTTSKSRRREERKRAKGKKGTVYEEEYLVSSVARLIVRVNSVHGEVERLVAGLRRGGMGEQARVVAGRMEEVVNGCNKVRGEVWPETLSGMPNGNASGSGEGDGSVKYEANGGGRPPGADGVLWDSLNEVDGAMKKAPEVKAWNGGLSLL